MKFIYFCVLVSFLLISCNSDYSREMDSFVSGEIQSVEEKKDNYSFILKTKHDAVRKAVAFKDQVKKDTLHYETLEKGDRFQFKGQVIFFKNPKDKKNFITVIKEARF